MSKYIEPYDPEWNTRFENIKEVLLAVLTGLPVDIQHVGSTSIPGMFAKPILDIDIIIYNKDLLEKIADKLTQAGYQSRGEQGIPGRFAFRQTSVYTPENQVKSQWMAHHLYVCYADSLALKNHILFRNLLLKEKTTVEAYCALKKSLTDNLAITRAAYTTGKTAFIVAALARAGLNSQELAEIADANK